MNKRQDAVYPRTPSDLERKYNLDQKRKKGYFFSDEFLKIKENGEIDSIKGRIAGWEIFQNYLRKTFTLNEEQTYSAWIASWMYIPTDANPFPPVFGIRVDPGDWLAYLRSNGKAFFDEVATTSGTITTSDRNLKNSISPVSEQYRDFFDRLEPVTHKYNNGTSDRLHLGFIAQDVDRALTEAGLTREEFAGICIENEGTEAERWSLRYSEFIPLCVLEIQKLKQEVKELRELVENLEKPKAEPEEGGATDG